LRWSRGDAVVQQWRIGDSDFTFREYGHKVQRVLVRAFLNDHAVKGQARTTVITPNILNNTRCLGWADDCSGEAQEGGYRDKEKTQGEDQEALVTAVKRVLVVLEKVSQSFFPYGLQDASVKHSATTVCHGADNHQDKHSVYDQVHLQNLNILGGVIGLDNSQPIGWLFVA